jgi:hypothetical protein
LEYSFGYSISGIAQADPILPEAPSVSAEGYFCVSGSRPTRDHFSCGRIHPSRGNVIPSMTTAAVSIPARHTNAYGWKRCPARQPNAIPLPLIRKVLLLGLGLVLLLFLLLRFMTLSSQVAKSLGGGSTNHLIDHVQLT